MHGTESMLSTAPTGRPIQRDCHLTILDTIVEQKWAEIAAAKAATPAAELERRVATLPPTRDFANALKLPGMRIIAEVKKASPSAGVIRTDFDPATIARTYERHGADCLSVLTDKQFFQGGLEHLIAARAATRIPALRKEFILDRYQLLESRAAGADAILLIAEILPGDRLKTLVDQATQLGLHVLVELHDAEQLARHRLWRHPHRNQQSRPADVPNQSRSHTGTVAASPWGTGRDQRKRHQDECRPAPIGGRWSQRRPGRRVAYARPGHRRRTGRIARCRTLISNLRWGVMHNIDLILTFTGSLAAALVFGYLSYRIGLSPIVGYLLAGIVVGPYTPGFVADPKLAEQMAEIGVILLMFGVGLHFDLKDLLEVRGVALPGAVAQSLVATGVGALLCISFGWNWRAGLVFGLALSVASTVVLTRVLSDNRDLHTPIGHIAIGWLVVEDIFTVFVLVLLPALFGPEAGAGASAVAIALLVALAKIVGLVRRSVHRRRARDSQDPRPGVAHPLPRTIHAHRARPRPGDRGRVGKTIRRVDGPWRVPGRNGRRSVRA